MKTNRGLLFLSLFALNLSLTSVHAKPIELRWLAAHNPDNVKLKTLVDETLSRIQQRTAGEVTFRMLYPNDMGKNGISGDSPRVLLNGRADFIQSTVSSFVRSSPDVGAFDMPLIFRNYHHAGAVFNGPVGQRLLAGIARDTQDRITAYGFTYSGGYRVFMGTKPVSKVADFKGLRMRDRGGPVREAFLQELGIRLVRADEVDHQPKYVQFRQGLIDLEEGEINKFAIDFINAPEVKLPHALLSYHNMYITVIAGSTAALKRLTEFQRQVVREELERLAIEERKLSIAQEVAHKAQLNAMGVKFSEFKGQEADLFKALALKVHKRFADTLGPIVRDIQAVKDPENLTAASY